jgi:hypothetical protein
MIPLLFVHVGLLIVRAIKSERLCWSGTLIAPKFLQSKELLTLHGNYKSHVFLTNEATLHPQVVHSNRKRQVTTKQDINILTLTLPKAQNLNSSVTFSGQNSWRRGVYLRGWMPYKKIQV